MAKPYSKDFREKALKLYASEKTRTVGDIAKELGISLQLLAQWAQRAGIGRNSMGRRKVVAKRRTLRKVVTKRSALDGSLRIVAELVTSPGLNNNQRIKMIAAYLNER